MPQAGLGRRAPLRAATRQGNVLAYRLWLTFSVTVTASFSGGEVNIATFVSLS